MDKTWLLIDVPNLCWRAYYSTGGLTHQEMVTGVAFGFFRDVLSLQEYFSTTCIAFCFDQGKSLRKKLYPAYKAKREDDIQKKEVRRLIDQIRDEFLPELGFNNVLSADGYEADDIIGSLCKHSIMSEEAAIIVSSDKDFYQLLNDDYIVIWNPRTKSIYNQDSLMNEFGVHPSDWVRIKSMSGCPTDNIAGVPGVKEKTAIRYLKLSLPTSYKVYKAITESRQLIRDNRLLVRLPFEGCPEFRLQEDSVSKSSWDKLFTRLGMKSLRRKLV